MADPTPGVGQRIWNGMCTVGRGVQSGAKATWEGVKAHPVITALVLAILGLGLAHLIPYLQGKGGEIANFYSNTLMNHVLKPIGKGFMQGASWVAESGEHIAMTSLGVAAVALATVLAVREYQHRHTESKKDANQDADSEEFYY